MTRHLAPILLCSVLAVGCKKAEPAPDAIEDMMNYLFAHFDDEKRKEVKTLQELADNLEAFTLDHLEEAEDGWQVSQLTGAELAAAGVKGKDIDGVVGAAASIPYTHKVEPVVEAITWKKKGEVFPHLVEFKIKKDDDLGCFLDQECLTYDAEVHQVAETGSVAGKATQDLTLQHRWLERDDGSFVYLFRTLSPDPIDFSGTFLAVKQQYSTAIVFPHKGSARRVEAFWIEGEIIGFDAPESSMVNQAVKAMGDSGELIDEFLDER